MDFGVAQLALVFLPGLIWASVDAKYGAGLKPQQTTLLIRSFMFGLTTYSVLYLVYRFFGWEFGYASLANGDKNLDIFKLKDEISFSIPLSIVLSVIWLWSVRFRLIPKFLNAINASRRYGDEDVWSYTFNSNQPHVEYVHIRDLENNSIFAGWVNTYSENEEYREILLRDVVVYNSDGDEISRAPYLYLSRPKHNVWIEFPYDPTGAQNVR
ncbi:MAG: hypothetical protein ACI9U6_000645 [Loktanella salsilacus]|jgi:hypothetical protein|uniref:DUF6338 family protein n=1 Tax=Loktanella salsilacus TaxID=195913 RepID=UPI0039896C61